MRRLLKLTPAILGLMTSGALQAADIQWNFDDATQTNGFLIVGNRATNCWNNTGGNPDTGGFLEMLQAVDGQNCVLVFPDVDGFPIKAFHMHVDVRVGNDGGDLNGRAADGFSVSYCREGDPITYWAAQGQARGAAGGDSDAQALEDPANPASCDSGDFENGTKTGVSIVFDAWQGNRILNNAGQAVADTEGIAVRVDDRTLTAIDMSGFRNGNCYGIDDGQGVSIPDPTCASTVCTNWQSMATGPSDGIGPLVNGNLTRAGTGAYTNLCWATLDVELNTNKQVTVIWKGHVMLDHYQLANYAPHKGRLVFMGRTGGNNQNAHFDNLHLITVPATDPLVAPPVPNLFGFTSQITDNGPTVTAVPSVLFDGVEVRSQCTVTKSGAVTTVTFAQTTPLVPGSTHSVRITTTTSGGNTVIGDTLNFTMVQYTTIPASLSVPANSIDQNAKGFVVQPFEAPEYLGSAPNRNYFADEQLFGYHGTNIIDFTVLNGAIEGNKIAFDQNLAPSPVIDFSTGPTPAAQFPVDYPFSIFGIPQAPYLYPDNSALAINSYLYFPVAGMYTIGVNSDDGFRLQFARNARDVLGQQIMDFDGGRGAAANQNLINLYIAQPGYYGTRLLWYNGCCGSGNGANLEFYTTATPTTNEVVLINNTDVPTSIKAFRASSAGPAYYSLAEPPLQDNLFRPDKNLVWEITDAGTTVVGNPTVKVDNVPHTPVVTHPGGGITHFEVAPAPLWPGGTHTISLSFQDSGGSTITNSYTFTVIQTLNANTATPVGSGSVAGFRMMGHQNPNTNIINGFRNQIQMANQIAEGDYLADVSARSVFTSNGEVLLPGIINFSVNNAAALTQNGNFQSNSTPSRPDVAFPGFGVWTPPAGGPAAMDNEAAVFRTFLEFPAAGVYTMGVNSDDGFRVTLGDRMSPGHGLVYVLAPASVAGNYKSAQTERGNGTDGLFGGPVPTGVGIIAQAVLADPIQVNGPLLNGPALRGKIAIVERGSGIGFNVKAQACQEQGAIACILVDNTAAEDPGIFGGDNPAVTIPCITVTKEQGDPLIAAGTTDTNSPIIMRVGDDASQNLGQFQGGRGASDTTFQFYVPQAGVYPMRLLWFNGGGDANLEWFMVDDAGVKTPINDPASTVKAWQARTAPARATINKPTLVGGNVVVSWTGSGELEMAASPIGPWVKAPFQDNPAIMPPIPGLKSVFYRVRTF